MRYKDKYVDEETLKAILEAEKRIDLLKDYAFSPIELERRIYLAAVRGLSNVIEE